MRWPLKPLVKCPGESISIECGTLIEFIVLVHKSKLSVVQGGQIWNSSAGYRALRIEGEMDVTCVCSGYWVGPPVVRLRGQAEWMLLETDGFRVPSLDRTREISI